VPSNNVDVDPRSDACTVLINHLDANRLFKALFASDAVSFANNDLPFKSNPVTRATSL
jgi:hypothetical protein